MPHNPAIPEWNSQFSRHFSSNLISDIRVNDNREPMIDRDNDNTTTNKSTQNKEVTVGSEENSRKNNEVKTLDNSKINNQASSVNDSSENGTNDESQNNIFLKMTNKSRYIILTEDTPILQSQSDTEDPGTRIGPSLLKDSMRSIPGVGYKLETALEDWTNRISNDINSILSGDLDKISIESRISAFESIINYHKDPDQIGITIPINDNTELNFERSGSGKLEIGFKKTLD